MSLCCVLLLTQHVCCSQIIYIGDFKALGKPVTYFQDQIILAIAHIRRIHRGHYARVPVVAIIEGNNNWTIANALASAVESAPPVVIMKRRVNGDSDPRSLSSASRGSSSREGTQWIPGVVTTEKSKASMVDHAGRLLRTDRIAVSKDVFFSGGDPVEGIRILAEQMCAFAYHPEHKHDPMIEGKWRVNGKKDGQRDDVAFAAMQMMFLGAWFLCNRAFTAQFNVPARSIDSFVDVDDWAMDGSPGDRIQIDVRKSHR